MTRISADNNVMRWTVTALAYAGTLPMIACVLWLEQPWSLPLLKAYSLAILAFLAGAWWAFALMNQKKVAPVLNMPNLTIEQRRGAHSHRELRYRG
jgi:hypothetical protein